MGVSIKAEEISRASFAPFGDLIVLEGARTFSCNQGRAVRHHDLAPHIDVMDEGGRAGLSVYRSVASPLPFQVEVMERHPLGSQAFMPLSGLPYLVVVAPAGAAPTLADLRVFLAQGQQGVNYAPGVWHHPLLALGEVSDFLVIDRSGPGANCDEIELQPAGWIIAPC